MPKTKVDKKLLHQLLRQGKSQREIAQRLGVHPSAVCRAAKEVGLAVAKAVTLEEGARVAREHIDIVHQLALINEKAMRMLDELSSEAKVVENIIKAVKKALAAGTDQDKEEAIIRKVVERVNRDRLLALKGMGEIRNQLEFQFRILEKLYDSKAVEAFQKVILEVIGSVAPDARDEILRRMHKESLLRQSLKLD